jgi:glutamyl-tRNA synthetase
LGLTWEEPVMVQSQRREVYDDIVADLTRRGLVYECFCSRADVRDAPRAPHTPPGAYPGTCRDLTDAQREERRAVKAPSLRLRAEVQEFSVQDLLAGQYTGAVEDVVVMRADGVPAYNLASVVDDSAQGVTQVVRGDDLLSSTPRQAYLAGILGLDVPEYLHVPLVMNSHGQRLSKRDASMSGGALWETFGGTRGLLRAIGMSLGLVTEREIPSLDTMARRFDPRALPKEPWTV